MDQEYTWDQCQYFGFSVDEHTGLTTFIPVVSFKEGMPIFDAGTPIQGTLAELVKEVPGLLGLYKVDDVKDSQLEGDNRDLGKKLQPSTLILPGQTDVPSIGKVNWGQ